MRRPSCCYVRYGELCKSCLQLTCGVFAQRIAKEPERLPAEYVQPFLTRAVYEAIFCSRFSLLTGVV
jgi:hypothetical protein